MTRVTLSLTVRRDGQRTNLVRLMRFRLRTLMIWLFTHKIGFFDKTNPRATAFSVLLSAGQSAIVVTTALLVLCKREWWAAWPFALLLGAVIGALGEWQRGSLWPD